MLAGRTIGLAAVVALVSGGVAVAEELVELAETVVVASGAEDELAGVPHAVTVIREDEARLRLQAPTLAESLDAVPGVMLQKTGHGMTSPYLRGWTSQRVVLVADGVRLNNSFLREGPNQYWNQVDPYFFKDLEVMMGPNSVLYGSDAIGGVVYARSTPLTRGVAGDGAQWMGGEGLFRFASAEDSFSEHLDGEMAFDDRFSLRLGLTRQDFGDLTSGDGVDNPHTGYEQWGANLRGKYWFDDDHALVLGYDHFDQDGVDRTHRTIYHQDFEGTLSKGSASDLDRIFDHDRRTLFARYEMRNGDGWLKELDAQVFYSRFEEYYVRYRSATDTRFRPTEIDTLGATLQMRTPSDWGTWSYGGDFYYDWVGSTGYDVKSGVVTNNVQGLVADDSRYLLTGLYLSNELELGDVWQLTSGVRYTYAELAADRVNFPGTGAGELEGDWDALTGSVRLLYRATDRLGIYGGMSQGFRAPNLSDATREDDFGGGSEVPTANLDAEHFTTFELGARYRSESFVFDLVGYHTLIKDRVGRLKQGGSATKANLDDGEVSGIEIGGSWEVVDGWNLFGRLAWQEGREDTFVGREISAGPTVRPISRMQPLNGELGVRYAAPLKRWWFEAALTAAAEQDRYTDSELGDNRFPPGGTPSYLVGHLRAGYKFSESTDLAVALENVSDEAYRIHGSGVNEPGRNLLLTLRQRF